MKTKVQLLDGSTIVMEVYETSNCRVYAKKSKECQIRWDNYKEIYIEMRIDEDPQDESSY